MAKEKTDRFWTGERTPPDDAHRAAAKKEIMLNRVGITGEKVRDGLAQLILTVVELLRELMEKQAIRRMEAGSLSDEQIENLGDTFMALKKELITMKEYFELKDEDMNLNLGPITARETESNDKASAVEILDRLLGKGVIIKGDLVISVAEVDLLTLNIGLLLASMDKAAELYAAPSTQKLEEEVRKLRDENERLKRLQ
jgi:hypothetical protein